MAKPVEVEMEKDGLRAVVLEESVPNYLRRGWTLVEDGSSETGSSEPVDTSETGSPEPVDEPDVNTYVFTDDEEE